MKNLKINKKALCSLLLAGTISLNAVGCTRDIIKRNKENKNTNTTVEETMQQQETYINKYGAPISMTEFNNHAYVLIDGDRKYTLCEGANIYFKSDWNIEAEEINASNIIVDAISTNGKYTFVELPSSEKGYVDTGYLVKTPNLFNSEYIDVNKDSNLALDAYMYDENGLYITYLHQGQDCHIIKANNNYALITLPGGRNGYVTISSTMNVYRKVCGYAFVGTGTKLYSDKKLMNLYRVTGDEILYLESIANTYATIYDSERNVELYVAPTELKSNFIDINLNTQRMDCYLDYQLTASWNTRSGKDSTPTHTGAFDIDAKASDWEFTTYPGSYAKYWIPISTENQEGIHDLVGDDEQNYGNSAYHEYGSHGCIRVPLAASKFVYDNYEVGDMVLVKRK